MVHSPLALVGRRSRIPAGPSSAEQKIEPSRGLRQEVIEVSGKRSADVRAGCLGRGSQHCALLLALVVCVSAISTSATAGDAVLHFMNPYEQPSYAGAALPRLDLAIGAPREGVKQVAAFVASPEIPLLRSEGVPPWIRAKFARVRILGTSTGYLIAGEGSQILRLVGKALLESGDGRRSVEYNVELFAEIPNDRAYDDKLELLIDAVPSKPGKESRHIALAVSAWLEGTP